MADVLNFPPATTLRAEALSNGRTLAAELGAPPDTIERFAGLYADRIVSIFEDPRLFPGSGEIEDFREFVRQEHERKIGLAMSVAYQELRAEILSQEKQR